jgi:hypothetical protein
MQVNLKDKYIQILAIFMNTTLPTNGFVVYFHELYKKAYPLFTEIEKFYIYMDALQSETTVCQEILMKMEKLHVTELVRHFSNMTSFEEIILDKSSMIMQKHHDFLKVKASRLTIEDSYEEQHRLTEYSTLVGSTIVNRAEKILDGIRTWCETLIMLAELYESKKRE